MLKKIEFLIDSDDSDYVLVPVDSYEELKELVDDDETVLAYDGRKFAGTVYSFDPDDELNPSQYSIIAQTREWLEENLEHDEELSDLLENNYDGDIDEMANDYVEEYWETLSGPLMLETDAAGPSWGEHGIINVDFSDYRFYKQVDFAEYIGDI